MATVRFELVTQSPRHGVFGGTRTIDVWHLLEGKLINRGSIDLPGAASWTLIAGDPDEDGDTEIISASSVINVLYWTLDDGVTEEAVIPNVSGLIDVVRIADADNDGHDELIASGSAGRVTIYNPTQPSYLEETLYPVLFQSAPLGGFTQGLAIADIDGDGDNDVLVGLSGRENQIAVYENSIRPENQRDSRRSDFERVLEITMLDGSGIPGFRVGDADNDGHNEVIYNGKYVLEFYRDDQDRLRGDVVHALVDEPRRPDAVIGSFPLAGDDEPQGLRLVPGPLQINAAAGDDPVPGLEAGRTYGVWVEVRNDWGTAHDVRARLDAAEGSEVEVGNAEVSLGDILAGSASSNQEAPFLVTAPSEGIRDEDPFELLLTITAANGFSTRQYRDDALGTNDSRVTFRVPPPLLPTGAETLAIQTGDAIYEQAGVSIDYFDENYFSQWPSADALAGYRHLIVLDELSSLVPLFRDRFAAFVDGGGNVLVHGYDVAQIPSFIELDDPRLQPERDFAAEYLRVEMGSETVFADRVSGIAGDVIGNSLELTLRTSQYEYRPDVLVPTGGAIPIFRYSSGEVAGIRYEGDTKLIYLGFSINDIESAETRAELWRRIFAWFDQE